ncbi:hypothetical protein, partial [Mesorhizobium sp.]|uniref:hypothetical protein n=1 Tax=Mesorhizobium sp. TaxID=1871066 RepID=UPI0025E1AE08
MFFAARHKAFESAGGKCQNQLIFAPYSGVRAHQARELVRTARNAGNRCLFRVWAEVIPDRRFRGVFMTKYLLPVALAAAIAFPALASA